MAGVQTLVWLVQDKSWTPVNGVESELAKIDAISIDQFVAQALAEKIAVLMAKDYLENRAKSGSREKFEPALAKVPER